jgi:hypothetical protein
MFSTPGHTSKQHRTRRSAKEGKLMGTDDAKVEPVENQVCLSSFKAHWAKAQIDGPMQSIARYDDVAKLLITIGGFVLAVLANSYSVMLGDLRGKIDALQARSTSKLVFGGILIFFVSAAAVCIFQPKMRAREILQTGGDEVLKCHIEDWCTNIGRIILIKKLLLGIATVSFIVSFLVLMSLLLSLL